MIPENRIPTHPGRILLEEFLKPMNVSSDELARHLGVPTPYIDELIEEERSITPEMAWLLSGALATTPEFWMTLQSVYDLARKRPERHVQQLQPQVA